MALNFPSNPTPNQVYTGPLGQKWKWNGEAWISFNEIVSVPTASFALGGSGSFSGSLYGTASWAENALTSSNILGGKAPHVPYFITDTTLATSSIYQSGSSTVIINQDNATSANPEALYVWQPSTSSFNVISGKGNLDNYLQLNIQNTNQGPDASSDIVATANNGNESVNYIDVGINSENYTGFLGGPNDAYLYSTGEDLWIGNYSDGKNVYFFNSSSEASLITLTPSNTVDIPVTLNAPDITGSLEGTASWARNVITASHAINADFAGYAQNAGVAANGGVTQIVAGSGVSLIPSTGVGAVTVIATGVGGVTILSGSNVTQSFANSATWAFTHSLGTKTPVISVFDTNYNQVIPENIQLVDTASAIITFPTLESGFAIATVGGVTGNALSSSYSLLATYADTASFAFETDPVFVARSASLATTGSNVFRGNQTITGSIFSTGSNTFVGNQTITGNVTITGSLTVSGSSIFTKIGPSVFSGSVILVNGATGSLLGTASFATTASFVTGSIFSNGNLALSSSFATTASYALSSSYASNADLLDGKDSTVFATTGSNIFIGNQTITGSVIITGSSTLIGNQTITGSILMSGSSFISGVDYIDFDTTASNVGAVGRLLWNDTDGTLDLGLKGGDVTLQVGQEEVVRIVNKTGVNLTEAGYEVVRLDGAQGGRIKVALAKGDGDANSLDTLGLVTENIAVNQEGFVTTYGLVRGINTTGTLQGETWNDGDALYLSPTTFGALTNIPPLAPSHSVRMGYIVQSNPSQGSIFVKVDNGYELDELHNVLINTASLSYGDLLMRDGNNVWINSKQLSGSYAITGSLTVSGSGTFTNIGPANFTGSINITGSTLQSGNNTLIGNTILSGSINVSGSQTFNGVSAFYGNHTLSGSNTITGNTVLSGSIRVSGSSNFNNSEFIITGSTRILGNFDVKGTSTFSDTTFTITGSQLFSGSSNINGNSTITGSLNVLGNINVISGSSFTRWGNKLFNYGQFINTASISATANVSASFVFPVTSFKEGISITSSSRVTFENTGLYNLEFTALANQGTGIRNLHIWFRKTGSNIDNSDTLVQLQNNTQTLLAWNFAYPFAAGEYVEMWYHTDGANTSFPYSVAGSGFPAAPSIRLTVTQIA